MKLRLEQLMSLQISLESGIYNADLSVIETVSFTQKDSENNDVDFRSKSYFDKISNFKYDL